MRTPLGPLMRGNGFRNLEGTQLGWARSSGSEWVLLWFQCDKWGWDAQWGSKFTVEFQQVARLEQAFDLVHRRERIGFVLEGHEVLDEIRRMNNTVIERLPGTLAGSALTAPDGEGSEVVLLGERADSKKSIYGRDLWMNYYSMDDVHAWAAWFERHLPDFVELFEHKRYSPEALARHRFHEMMARVQATPDLDAKIIVLSDHVAAETDAHYRSAAEYWLGEARKSRGGMQ
jgi:hypothetical protein